jgi:hypothetical protein
MRTGVAVLVDRVMLAVGFLGLAACGFTIAIVLFFGNGPVADRLLAGLILAGAGMMYVVFLWWLVRVIMPEDRAGAVARERHAIWREILIGDLTWLAGLVAGQGHVHLRDAWAADLYGDPTFGALPSARRRMQLASGFVLAALRCRLDDASDLAWRPVDALLSSWHGSNLAVLVPVTIVVGLVLPREGLYGLITNAENLGVIAAAPYAAIKGLRRYRKISTPKRIGGTSSASGQAVRVDRRRGKGGNTNSTP